MPTQAEIDAAYQQGDVERRLREVETRLAQLMAAGLDRLVQAGYVQFDNVPMRWDNNGIQIAADAATQVALYFVQTLKTNPGAAPYRVVFQGAVTESSGLVGSDWQIESETSNEAAGFSLSIVNDSNSEASFSITYNGSTGSAGARWASSVGIPLFYVQDMGLALTSALSPAQITADQNNYNPADLAIAAVLRLSSDASRDITGLAGGADGRVLLVFNVGSNNIVLKDESASSTAANRFALNGDITLAADNSVILWYDATSSRWRAV